MSVGGAPASVASFPIDLRAATWGTTVSRRISGYAARYPSTSSLRIGVPSVLGTSVRRQLRAERWRFPHADMWNATTAVAVLMNGRGELGDRVAAIVDVDADHVTASVVLGGVRVRVLAHAAEGLADCGLVHARSPRSGLGACLATALSRACAQADIALAHIARVHVIGNPHHRAEVLAGLRTKGARVEEHPSLVRAEALLSDDLQPGCCDEVSALDVGIVVPDDGRFLVLLERGTLLPAVEFRRMASRSGANVGSVPIVEGVQVRAARPVVIAHLVSTEADLRPELAVRMGDDSVTTCSLSLPGDASAGLDT